jgi:uncharacterized protein YbcC (UPF0753/DUF2309 family)
MHPALLSVNFTTMYLQDTLVETTVANHKYDEGRVLHKLKHFLPSQTPLKDFIHHNSLHAFQHMKFYEAIFTASEIFGYSVTIQLEEFRKMYKSGRINPDILERVIKNKKGIEDKGIWMDMLLTKKYNTNQSSRIGHLRNASKRHYKIDLDNIVQPILFRILSSYLDQGIAVQKFPLSNEGFLESIITLEKSSFSGFIKSERAKNLLFNKSLSIADLLKIIVGDEMYFDQYLFDQQFSHRGWSGMVSTIEDNPDSLLDKRKISLKEMVYFELILEIDALDNQFRQKWIPLSSHEINPPVDIFKETSINELQEVLMLFHDAFEWSYYDKVLLGISETYSNQQKTNTTKSFQSVFCIDERECSLRRYLEQIDQGCETFGSPGFFGVEFYFKAQNAKFLEKLCPAPVTPKYLIKESGNMTVRKHELLYNSKSHHFFEGTFFTLGLGFWAAVRMLMNIVRPKMSPAISNAFLHVGDDAELTIENFNPGDTENGLQIGFSINEMTVRVEMFLRNIGMIKNFSPLVYVVAHGSSSANNPHHGAHDCGACSGRPGSVNARVLSFMANHVDVRDALRKKGIDIPKSTQFLGALHDTAADKIVFYDTRILTILNKKKHNINVAHFESALDLNARERSRRFSSINSEAGIKTIRKAINKRSVSLFEPRPELGHGSNALCIIGRREMTKNLFLDRRAFLNSYDYTTDPSGELLANVIRPIGPVCGGINLEYYFSRIDNHKLGAGTKLPHNVIGLIGVSNSSDGDLRPGLPLQMIEVHDPVRLLVVIEHSPEVVLNVLKSSKEIYQWYINDWIHLVVIDPFTKNLYDFENGVFKEYQIISQNLSHINQNIFRNSMKMKSSNIIDSTKENLPVFSIN